MNHALSRPIILHLKAHSESNTKIHKIDTIFQNYTNGDSVYFSIR